MVSKTQIPFSKTNALSKIFLSYIEGDASLTSFFKYAPDLSSFKHAIADKSKERIDRQLLVRALLDQYSELSDVNCQLLTQNIQILANSSTFTITTGHQLCLFTGPLYFIYKAISVINLAEQLKQHFPNNDFVPVFWLASEDHDFEEINIVNIFGKTLEWVDKQGGATGRYNTSSLSALLEQLEGILGNTENAVSLMRLFRIAYLEHETLTEATRYILHHLFGKYGLVVLDADDARLKATFADIMEDDLTNQTLYQLVTETNKRLAKHYKPHVNPRDINLFHLQSNSRQRIGTPPLEGLGEAFLPPKKEGSGMVSPAQFSSSDIAANPQDFSPNVLLRCLYQETVLPNLAYIGGPAEVAYWLQLKTTFEHYNINYPIVLPRNSALWVDGKSQSRMDALGVSSADIFRDIDTLIKQVVSAFSQHDLNVDDQIKEIDGVFDSLTKKTTRIDNTLERMVDAERTKAQRSVHNIGAKMAKAEKRDHEDRVNQLRSLRSKLFPNGGLQERHDNFMQLYLQHGEAFIETLKANLDPLDFRLTIFSEGVTKGMGR